MKIFQSVVNLACQFYLPDAKGGQLLIKFVYIGQLLI